MKLLKIVRRQMLLDRSALFLQPAQSGGHSSANALHY